MESEGSVIEGTNKTRREGMTLVGGNWQLFRVLGMTRKGDSVRVGRAMVKQVAMQEELYGVEARVIRRYHLRTRFYGDAGAL